MFEWLGPDERLLGLLGLVKAWFGLLGPANACSGLLEPGERLVRVAGV